MDQHTLTREIMQYLELVIRECSSLPAFYPQDMTFQQLAQPIGVLSPYHGPGWEGSFRPPLCLDPTRTEHLRWAGYDWETETYGYQRFRWEHRPWRISERASRRLVMLGNQGSGKSWFLRTTALRVARQQADRLDYDQRFSRLTLPLFFPADKVAEALAQDTTEAPSLINTILALLRQHMDFSEVTLAWVKSQLLTQRAVLLLDDLHLVSPTQEARFFTTLQTFCQHSRATVLATAHPAGYTGRLFLNTPDALQEHLLASFTWSQVRGFVLNWFASQRDRGEQLLEVLHADPFLRSITRLPVFLPWLCHLAASHEPLPTRRVELYEAVLRVVPSHELQTYPIFQDYLEARRLSQLPFELLWNQVRPHLWCDPLWENRILLLVGCMENPTPFLRAMLAEEHDVFHWILLLAGRCLAETEQTRVDPKLVQELTDRLLVLYGRIITHKRVRKQEYLQESIDRSFALYSAVIDPERMQAMAILERIARPMMLDHYMAQMHNTLEKEKQLEAIARLGIMGDASAISHLLNWHQQKEENWLESPSIYRALEQCGGWESAQVLLALLQRQPNWGGHTADRPNWWAVTGALQRIQAPGVMQELLALMRRPATSEYFHDFVIDIIAKSGDGEALETLLSWLEQRFPDEQALYHWLAVAPVTKRGEERWWVTPFLQALPQWAARGRAYHLPAFDLWRVLEEPGSPQAEYEIQQAFVLSIENAPNAFKMAREWEGVELLLEEEQIEALLRHPSREVRTSLLMRLGSQGDSRAIDGLLALFQSKTIRGVDLERLISLLGRFDDKRIGAALLAVFQHNNDFFDRETLLDAIAKIGDRQIAEALLTMVQAEEATTEYLDGLATRGEITGDLRIAAAYILGRLGDPRGRDIACDLISEQSAENPEWRTAASHVLCMLTRMGDEQALEALRGFLLDGYSARGAVARGWRWEVFLRTGPGMEIAVYWYDVWSLSDAEGHIQPLVSRHALKKLIYDNDPGELVEELLMLWSDDMVLNSPLAVNNGVNVEGAEGAIETTRRSAIYKILALCAPLLARHDAKGERQWRQRLVQLVPDVPA